MQCITDPNFIFPAKTSVAMGMFDGVHKGHRALLNLLMTLPGPHVVATFENHPSMVLGRPVSLLSTQEERLASIASYGVEYCTLPRFTKETASLSKEEYVRELVTWLHPAQIVIGFNHTFGHGGAGCANDLLMWEDTYGYKTSIVSPLEVDGLVASSTSVRALLVNGNVKDAAALLGAPYALTGVVEKGEQLGRTLGFPTINIRPPGKLVPAFGVYGAIVFIRGAVYKAVLNIGRRPTVSGGAVTIEAHLLDTTGDFYDDLASAQLIEYLRPEQKFEGLEELKAQLQKDCAQARMVLETFNHLMR